MLACCQLIGCGRDQDVGGETAERANLGHVPSSVSLVNFKRIEATIDMEEHAVEFPVPDYELVDVAGNIKNAPASVACGGSTSEGAAADADACLLRPQLTFTNGYLDTNGTVTAPNAATYSGEVANYEVDGYVGDIVELTVNNRLPEAANGEAIATGFFAPANNLQTVHWHGMELDNESDGTPISETGIETGRSRLYRFRLYRPGPFWFHPHIMPLLTESRGMVGRLIVRSEAEDTLEKDDVLPTVYKAVTLSDVVVANETNRTLLGPGNVVFEHFSDEEVDNHLLPDISPDLNGDGECDRGAQGRDCIVNEGELVLVNGKVPTSDQDIETITVEEGGGARIAFINSSNERFYRLRLLLDGETPPTGPSQRVGRSTTGQCYAGVGAPKFSGADPLSCEQGLPLFRVGGEGGLLDRVRLEGQPELQPGEAARVYDTVIRTGEDVIGPSERTDVVVVTKDRNGNYLQPGQSMFIWTVDYPHGIFTPKFDNGIGDGQSRNRDIAARRLVKIEIVEDHGQPQSPYDIAVGDPLMVHPDVDKPTEDLKSLPINTLSAAPSGVDSAGNAFAGTADANIKLDNHVAADGTRYPAINNTRGQYSGVVGGIGDTLPTQASTRYARVGDVIEFVYANDTGAAHHPFHMHGFSFQPISIHTFTTSDPDEDGIEDTILDETPIYTYDYNEFVDVIVMQPHTAVKFRMKMNDRFKIPDAASFSFGQLKQHFPFDRAQPFGGAGDVPNSNADMGGAIGRWLFHCHILHHAALGMIADLCVAPQGAPDASGCKIDIDENITQPIQ